MYQIAKFKQNHEGYTVETDLYSPETSPEDVLVVYVRHPISQNVKYVAVEAKGVAKKGYISARVIHNIAKQIINNFKPDEEIANIPIPEENAA